MSAPVKYSKMLLFSSLNNTTPCARMTTGSYMFYKHNKIYAMRFISHDDDDIQRM